jgi:predicted nuclease of predicted toxin-antitoxin system
MRFKLDENLPQDLADVLKAGGHDVHTVGAEGLAGAKDASILTACRNEGRAIITFDLDFADIRTYPPADYPGLIVLRLSSQAARHTVAVLSQAIRLLSTEPLSGHLWVVEDAQVRIL